MTRLCLSLLAFFAVASAFTSPVRVNTKTAASVANSRPLFMFSADDAKKNQSPLSEVKPGESADAVTETTQLESSSDNDFTAAPVKPTMTVRNRNTGKLVEVEVTESFLANERLEMSWWAWLGFVGLPVVLLSNDVFHYLPTEGPLGFLGRF